jgi:hypothetical protein
MLMFSSITYSIEIHFRFVIHMSGRLPTPPTLLFLPPSFLLPLLIPVA